MKYALVVDSSGDISLEEYAARNIVMIPLTIDVDGGTYKDQVEITSEEFYKRMAHDPNLPKTSQPSPNDFVTLYQSLADEGYEAIISMHISGLLSGTKQSAAIAADQVNIPVEIIDTRIVTVCTGLTALYAADLRDAGVDFAEAVEKVRNVRESMVQLLCPSTLENLLKGGRLSKEEAIQANMLNIKPILGFDMLGKLINVNKVKGNNGAIKFFVQSIEELTAQKGQQKVRFIHSGDLDAVNRLKKRLEEAGVDYVDYGTSICGATVGTHLGADALGIACMPAQMD